MFRAAAARALLSRRPPVLHPPLSSSSSRLNTPIQAKVPIRWFQYQFRRDGYEYFQRPNHDQQQGSFIANNRRLLIFTGSLGSMLGLYYVTHLEKVPISDRTRFMTVSKEEEREMGRMAYNAIMLQYRNRLLPPYNPYVKLVRRVAADIVRVAGLDSDTEWEVNVISSDDVNAFVLPGGKIFVFTGILRVTGDEHGLAAVLGHEIAHQYARHTAEKASLFQLAFLLKFLLSFVLDTSLLFNPLLVQLGVNLPFSRKCETEADYLGLMLMSQACYDPREAIRFWQRMAETKQGQGVEWASTHPIPRNRIEKIKEWMPQALNRYHLSNCDVQVRDDFDQLRSKLFKF